MCKAQAGSAPLRAPTKPSTWQQLCRGPALSVQLLQLLLLLLQCPKAAGSGGQGLCSTPLHANRNPFALNRSHFVLKWPRFQAFLESPALCVCYLPSSRVAAPKAGAPKAARSLLVLPELTALTASTGTCHCTGAKVLFNFVSISSITAGTSTQLILNHIIIYLHQFLLNKCC